MYRHMDAMPVMLVFLTWMGLYAWNAVIAQHTHTHDFPPHILSPTHTLTRATYSMQSVKQHVQENSSTTYHFIAMSAMYPSLPHRVSLLVLAFAKSSPILVITGAQFFTWHSLEQSGICYWYKWWWHVFSISNTCGIITLALLTV